MSALWMKAQHKQAWQSPHASCCIHAGLMDAGVGAFVVCGSLVSHSRQRSKAARNGAVLLLLGGFQHVQVRCQQLPDYPAVC